MITLERIRQKKQVVRGVIYARFSSEMQRDESIDAQIRAIEEYAKRNNIVVVGNYIDKAKSATTDNRPEFQQMIADSAKNQFDVVLVHKLDRFARNRNDSIAYRMQLKRHGVALISALEYIDEGSPESIILESVLEAMAEYYSRNLAREVEKGKKENALKGKHVGGIPPLGYDLDRATMKLVINPHEAECIRLIFKRTLEGFAYKEISDELNRLGYKSKLGTRFAHNSLGSILRNQKYTGTYIYNKSSAKDVDGKRNGHKYKDESEIIRLVGAMPAIVSQEDFDLVQDLLRRRKFKTFLNRGKQNYFLSGKIICGVCGSSYTGNSRRPDPHNPLYISYRCCRFNKKANCKNREVRREILESIVFDNLAQKVFDPELIPKLSEAYRKYLLSRDSLKLAEIETCKKQLKDVDKEIANLISFIAKSASEAVAAELNSLEVKKTELQFALERLETELNSRNVSEIELTKAFNYAKELFICGQLVTTRKLVERFIHEVVVYPDRVHIYYNFGFSLEPLKHEVDTEAVKRRLPRRASAQALLQRDLEQIPTPAASNRGRKNAKTPQYPHLAERDTTAFSLAQPTNCAVGGGEREIRTLGWG